jgi:hypothetical protein
MTNASAIAAGLLALSVSTAPAATASAATGAAEGPRPCGPATSTAYPTFCGIPRTPTDVRSPKAFKAAVVDLRRAGRRLVRATGPDTFGLPIGEAEAFSRSGQAQAAPPAEISAAPSEDSEGAAAELRRLAAPPPPRPR